MNYYSSEEGKKFFDNDFPLEIWKDNYQNSNEKIEEYVKRQSNTIFNGETVDLIEELTNALITKRICFGGRVGANIGTGIKNVHAFNCYSAQRSSKPYDSIQNIYLDLLNGAEILKTEGGIGFNFNHLRPRGTLIKGIGSATPGVVDFMELYDVSAKIITKGKSGEKYQVTQKSKVKKKTRKGAQLSMLSVVHPDIIDYVEAKKMPNVLTKFNMSVAITDEFMNCVIEDKDWDLWFPDIHFEKYDSEWNGDFEDWKAKGYPIYIYQTVKARYLWDIIIKNSYNRNEPGIYFIDNANRYNNLKYHQKIVSTNPCFSGDTMVLTKDGNFPIEKLIGKEVEIYDGEQWVKINNFRITGENQELYTVTLESGNTITATPYHTFILENGSKIELNKLKIGDYLQSSDITVDGTEETKGAYVKGFLCAEGTVLQSNPALYVYITKTKCIDKIKQSIEELEVSPFNYNGIVKENVEFNISTDGKRYSVTGLTARKSELYDWCTVNKINIPNEVFNWKTTHKADFIAGVMDGDGNVLKGANGFGYQLCSVNKSFLQDFSILLKSIDVKSKISLMKASEEKDFGKSRGGVYKTKDCWRLTISQLDSIKLSKIVKFERLLDLSDRTTKNTVKTKHNRIKSIEFCGIADKVYCCTVPTNHSFVLSNKILVGQCGEISMISDSGVYEHNGILYEHLGDICNLGTINLVKYWENNKFNFDLLAKDIAILVRSLDNLIDISSYPLEKLKNAAMLRRKIGCGVMGYGSLLFMMGLKYGSDEANTFTKILSEYYANVAYQTSALLAKEKGTFILYDKTKIFNNGYIANSGILTTETLELIKQYGLRNSQLLTAAPNGNTSIIMGLVSGGIEPLFEKEYIRWANVSHKIEEEMKINPYPDFTKNEWFETDYFKFVKKGDEQILQSIDGLYQIDKNRGLVKQVECEDYGWKWVKENLSKEEILENESKGVYLTATELSVKEHLDPFIIWSKAIDNSISKTINILNTYPYEDFNDLYINLWKSGARGCTTYRAGTMTAVLETKQESDKTKKQIKEDQKEFFNMWKGHDEDKVFEDVSLPDEYPSKGFVLKSEGKKFYLHVAFKDKEMKNPFALFVHTNSKESDILTYSVLDILEKLAETEGIPQDFIEKNKHKCGSQNNINKLARTISLLLRHNVRIDLIVKAIDNLNEIPISSFIYRIKKFLMNYIEELDTNGMTCPECNEKVIFMEGCIRCGSCGWSKC